MPKPALSVLLPVRNALPDLRSSLASLERQSFTDFEIVAVDDGSSDGSGEWLERAATREPRLRVVRTAALGLPAALQTALAHARSPWIARHDADDLSHRARFAAQVEVLTARRTIDVLGTRVRLFPAASVGVGMRRWAAWHNALLTHESMARERFIDSPLAHGTAMMRRAALERVGGWQERGWAEDLDLWMRLFEAGARFAKLPQALYGWRQHEASATRRDPRYARERFIALKLDGLERTFLRGRARVTVAGVGSSLEHWCQALSASGAREVHAVSVTSPAALARARLTPPLVLVYGAAPARARLRTVLASLGLSEGEDAVFVA